MKSAILPFPNGPNTPIISQPKNFVELTSENDLYVWSEGCDSNDLQPKVSMKHHLFTQCELNDLVRDLGLTEDSTEILRSKLSEKNLLSQNTSYFQYRHYK